MVLPNKCNHCHQKTRFYLVETTKDSEVYECNKCGRNNHIHKSYNRSKMTKGNRY